MPARLLAVRPVLLDAAAQTARRRPIAGGAQLPVGEGREAARAFFSELAAKFPAAESIAGGFTTLAIPVGLNVPAGSAAWYGLWDFDPSTLVPSQDVVFFGSWIDLVSCNPNPTTPANEAAWGDQYGYGAAIVIGLNLPTVGADGSWVYSPPPPVVGIDSSTAVVRNARTANRFFARTFPSGKYTTGWNKRGLPPSIVPFVRRVPQGSRLGCAFVLNRTQANNGAGKNILAGVETEGYFGLTKMPVEQRE